MFQHTDQGSHHRADDFLQLFKRGAEFTQELLRENERLRFQIVKLEDALKELQRDTAAAVPESAARLLGKIEELEREKSEILSRIRRVEEENQDFANRYVEIEAENRMLADLYLASFQLHATLDFNEVLRIVADSIINLLGAEEFAILLLDEKTNRLEPVAGEGIEVGRLPAVGVGEGLVGEAARSGESYFMAGVADGQQPFACVPLKIKEHVIGVLVIYRLLSPQARFDKVERQLCSLLAGHAATAIFAARLYSESERKLSTIQGFISLLTR